MDLQPAPALSIVGAGEGRFGHDIEDDERAPSQAVPALERFAVGPLESIGIERGAQLVKGVLKFARDGERLKLAVEHGAGGDVDQGAPAVVFGLVKPLAGFGQSGGERPAIDGAGGKCRRVHGA